MEIVKDYVHMIQGKLSVCDATFPDAMLWLSGHIFIRQRKPKWVLPCPVTGLSSPKLGVYYNFKATCGSLSHKTKPCCDAVCHKNWLNTTPCISCQTAVHYQQVSWLPCRYTNTAAVISRVSYIDGDKGILRYRGYPIEELAEQSSFLEVAYLVLYGDLPSRPQLASFQEAVARHTAVPEAVEECIHALPHDAHPMACILTGLTALSGCHPEQNPALAGQNVYHSKEIQDKQIVRLIGKVRGTSGINSTIECLHPTFLVLMHVLAGVCSDDAVFVVMCSGCCASACDAGVDLLADVLCFRVSCADYYTRSTGLPQGFWT